MRSEEQMGKIEELLRSESTAVLAVKDREGAVHSAPVFYWPGEGLRLYWMSSEKSRHSEALLANPNVSVSVFHATFEWREIVGLQMEGMAKAADGGERQMVLAGYQKRFRLNHLLTVALSASRLYCFRPKWVRYTDNRTVFGQKFDLTLE